MLKGVSVALGVVLAAFATGAPSPVQASWGSAHAAWHGGWHGGWGGGWHAQGWYGHGWQRTNWSGFWGARPACHRTWRAGFSVGGAPFLLAPAVLYAPPVYVAPPGYGLAVAETRHAPIPTASTAPHAAPRAPVHHAVAANPPVIAPPPVAFALSPALLPLAPVLPVLWAGGLLADAYVTPPAYRTAFLATWHVTAARFAGLSRAVFASPVPRPVAVAAGGYHGVAAAWRAGQGAWHQGRSGWGPGWGIVATPHPWARAYRGWHAAALRGAPHAKYGRRI
jgi:hypothetical protein